MVDHQAADANGAAPGVKNKLEDGDVASTAGAGLKGLDQARKAQTEPQQLTGGLNDVD